MWCGRCKRLSSGEIDRLNARCVLRGDLHKRFYHTDANQCFAPVVRSSSLEITPSWSLSKRLKIFSIIAAS